MTTFHRSDFPLISFPCVLRRSTVSPSQHAASPFRGALHDFYKLCGTLSVSVWRGVKNSREICTKLLTAMVLRRRS